MKSQDLRAFIKVKPDLYDFRKESNVYDSIQNLEICPLYTRTRRPVPGKEMLEEVVDWEKRKRVFRQVFFT